MPNTNGYHQLQKQLNKLATTEEIRHRFDPAVTAMTIFLWRKKRGMPAVILRGTARDSIRFIPREVRKWARQRQLSFRTAVNPLRERL